MSAFEIAGIVLGVLTTGLRLSSYAFSRPYAFIFRPSTRALFDEITNHGHLTMQRHVQKWLEQQRSEANLAQLGVRHGRRLLSGDFKLTGSFQAGLAIGSVAGMLSWPTIYDNHWVVPAFLYSSILLSVVTITMAAEQIVLIEANQHKKNLACFTSQYWLAKGGGLRWTAVLAWQAPYMCLSYALFFLVLGLSTHIIVPVARSGGVLNDDCRILIFFVSSACVSLSFFSMNSETRKGMTHGKKKLPGPHLEQNPQQALLQSITDILQRTPAGQVLEKDSQKILEQRLREPILELLQQPFDQPFDLNLLLEQSLQESLKQAMDRSLQQMLPKLLPQLLQQTLSSEQNLGQMLGQQLEV